MLIAFWVKSHVYLCFDGGKHNVALAKWLKLKQTDSGAAMVLVEHLFKG